MLTKKLVTNEEIQEVSLHSILISLQIGPELSVRVVKDELFQVSKPILLGSGFNKVVPDHKQISK